MARFSKIHHQPRRLADEVYQQILEAIAMGDIPAGEQLVQETLADEMTVSRTPIREALLRLEREGIIEPGPKRGFLVIEYTPERVKHVYQARQAVEGFASRLVAESASDDELELLRPLLTKTIDADDKEAAYEENRIAHREIVATSKNPALLEMFDSLFERATMLRVRSSVWASLTDHNHTEVFDALASRNPELAESAIVSHIEHWLDQQMESMRT